MVLRKAGYERLKRINRMWFADAEAVDSRDIPDMSTDRFDLDHGGRSGGQPAPDRVCVCDLTNLYPGGARRRPGFES